MVPRHSPSIPSAESGGATILVEVGVGVGLCVGAGAVVGSGVAVTVGDGCGVDVGVGDGSGVTVSVGVDVEDDVVGPLVATYVGVDFAELHDNAVRMKSAMNAGTAKNLCTRMTNFADFQSLICAAQTEQTGIAGDTRSFNGKPARASRRKSRRLS